MLLLTVKVDASSQRDLYFYICLKGQVKFCKGDSVPVQTKPKYSKVNSDLKRLEF